MEEPLARLEVANAKDLIGATRGAVRFLTLNLNSYRNEKNILQFIFPRVAELV